MDTANEEFKTLLARSGWNQSEAARKLELTSASVSRYVNDIDKPAKQTLRLFRLYLADAPSIPHGNGPANNKKTIAKLRGHVQELRKNIADIESALDTL